LLGRESAGILAVQIEARRRPLSRRLQPARGAETSCNMSTLITEECINCGACEPECPNTAIYEGGAPWELDGATNPAIKEDIYYIAPQKCTECVGFFDQEQCAAVCPVDCCIPDPNIPESEEILLERARRMHPDQTFGADFPSRFKKG
jgi:ferredoxin